MKSHPPAKPAPLGIATAPPTDPSAATPLYLGRLDAAERERVAVLLRHAPALLHELKAAVELLLGVCDHYRQDAPLPSAFDCRRTAMDALNVIALAEGRATVGTRHYPPIPPK